MWKWLSRALSGSDGPSCRLHETVLPLAEVLVLGMCRLTTGRPFRSQVWSKSVCFTVVQGVKISEAPHCEFANSSSSVEAGSEACENSRIQRVVQVEPVSEFDNKLYSVGATFLPFGRFGCHFGSGLQDGVHLDVIQFPCNSIQDMPCPDSTYVIGNRCPAV